MGEFQVLHDWMGSAGVLPFDGIYSDRSRSEKRSEDKVNGQLNERCAGECTD